MRDRFSTHVFVFLLGLLVGSLVPSCLDRFEAWAAEQRTE